MARGNAVSLEAKAGSCYPGPNAQRVAEREPKEGDTPGAGEQHTDEAVNQDDSPGDLAEGPLMIRGELFIWHQPPRAGGPRLC